MGSLIGDFRALMHGVMVNPKGPFEAPSLGYAQQLPRPIGHAGTVDLRGCDTDRCCQQGGDRGIAQAFKIEHIENREKPVRPEAGGRICQRQVYDSAGRAVAQGCASAEEFNFGQIGTYAIDTPLNCKSRPEFFVRSRGRARASIS